MGVLRCQVWLFATPWAAALQAPLSIGFSRQEYWRAFPFPLPGGLPDPGIKPTSPVSPELVGKFFTTAPSGKPHFIYSSMCVLIPNSSLSFCPPFPFGNHKFVFYVCESTSIFKISFKISLFVSVFFKIPHLSDIWYLSFSVWCISLSMIISRSICKWHYLILFF